MTTKTKLPAGAKTLVKGHFAHKLYDYLNTGSLDPTEIKIPYCVKYWDGLYFWEAETPLGKTRSSHFKIYDNCLESLQEFIDRH